MSQHGKQRPAFDQRDASQTASVPAVGKAVRITVRYRILNDSISGNSRTLRPKFMLDFDCKLLAFREVAQLNPN